MVAPLSAPPANLERLGKRRAEKKSRGETGRDRDRDKEEKRADEMSMTREQVN